MDSELLREIALRVNRAGDNEIRLAMSKAVNKGDVNEIVELINEARKPYTEGRVATMGCADFASQESWARIAEESDNAARRELMGSTALAELDELERKARDAQQAAERKNLELNAAWIEYHAIPERIEQKEVQLAQIANEMRNLDPEQLANEFKRIYRIMLDGGIVSGSFLPDIALTLCTSDLRIEVLNEKADGLDREVAELKARAKTLGKRLGQKS